MTSQNNKVDTDSAEAPVKGVGCGALVRRWLFLSRATQWDERIMLGFAWVDTHESGCYGTPIRRKYLEILIGRKGFAIGWIGYPQNDKISNSGA